MMSNGMQERARLGRSGEGVCEVPRTPEAVAGGDPPPLTASGVESVLKHIRVLGSRCPGTGMLMVL